MTRIIRAQSASPYILNRVPLLAIVAVYVALFVYYVQATFIGQPYWDMLSIVTRYLQYLRDGNIWSYLWEPHVQHRQLWMRLLTAFDAQAFSGVAYPFVVMAVVCQATTAWLLYRESRRGVVGRSGLWLGSLALLLTLTSVAAVDCALPMNGIYPQTTMFAVLAIVLGARGSGRGGARWHRLFIVLAAIGAAFGNAAGLAVWPVLIWLAWQGSGDSQRSGKVHWRDGMIWMLALLVIGATFSTVYLIGIPGLPLMSGGAGTAPDLAQGLRTFDYLITYLGLPWTRSAGLAALAKVIGAVLLLTGVTAVVWGLSRRIASQFDRVGLALIAFALATAALAAFGRSTVDADLRVPVRYSVFVGLLHVGLLFLAWPRLAALLESGKREQWLYAGVIAVALILTGQQIVAGQAAVETTRAMRAVLARFAAGEESAEMTAVVYVDLRQARRDLDAIYAAGLYRNVR